MLKKLTSTRLNEFVSPDVAICILRIGASALIMTHGIPKLMRVFEGDFNFGDPLGIGAAPSLVLCALAEAVCAGFLLVGLASRLVSIPLIINMSVVFFIVHGEDPFGRRELPLFFLVSFVSLFLTGPGKLSLDHLLFNKSR